MSERRPPVGMQYYADGYPDGIVGAAATGEVTVLNRGAARMLGTTIDEAVGEQLGDVLQLLDDRGRTWLEVNRPFEAINIQTGIPEQSWFLPSGQEVLVTASIVRPEPLAPVVGVGIGMRSGRGRARLDRDRSDLVAAVAHELRSPLTGVKGFVQAILQRWDRLTDEQKKLMLTTVNADADRLTRLITELLDVARIDTNRLSLSPQPIDVAHLAERVVDSALTAHQGREVRSEIPADLPRVHFDPDKLTQVLTNLVDNGLSHGAGAVTLSAEQLDGRLVQVAIDDEGTGIDPEIRRRVFTKFWRHGVTGGTGLGMYIVNGLVRAHGGEVELTDSASGGARVLLRLPVADADH